MKSINIITIIFFILTIKLAIGQVGIGTTSPNSDAALDINSSNQGVLLTRVPLTNSTLASPLSSHVAGMIIYNTATSGDVIPGMYYNNGTQWIRMANPTYREHFTQSSSLAITSNSTYFTIPGLDGVSITVPETGYYQFDFTGYYATPSAEEDIFATQTYFCNGEGFFRIRVNGNTKTSYIHSTSFTEETVFDSNYYYDLASSANTTFQIYLPAGTHTINVDFYQYALGNHCIPGTNATVGGLYGGSDDATLSVFYVGQ